MGRLPLLIILLLLAVFLMPSAILACVLMVPSLVAFIVDRNKQRYLTMTVGLPNFCGILPALTSLWERGQTFDGAFSGIADPWNMMVAYSAAGFGWMVYFGVPVVVSSYLSISTEGKIKQVRKYQEDLVEAWGESVRQAARATASPEENENDE
ncbi:hypothetical protein O4H49_08385 [Kiloniella laminariae]|uniref:Acyl-CoA synthetase n=1 Tax=Kiloniella laminariae TaxID=454162 RepID=A0ABT4LI57_9PROT|nr:hypothetical protein [Kiloniella laminariae]MCZ4280792.1 hypothetical protein [Kiloniella laminariae]